MYHAASADPPGAEEAVLALIEAGADVNQIDDRSWSPLHEASYWGRLSGSFVRFFFMYGMFVVSHLSAQFIHLTVYLSLFVPSRGQ